MIEDGGLFSYNHGYLYLHVPLCHIPYFHGEEELVVTNEGINFQWKDHGFKLHIPENGLCEGIPEYSINIKASLASQFELPDGYELVSAVYWVKTSGKFMKPV